MARAQVLVEQDEKWRKVSDFTMRYETMIQDPYNVVKCLASVLTGSDVGDDVVLRIVDETKQLNYDTPGERNKGYHKETLYHDGHITDGRHGSWEGDLDPEFVRRIEDKYHDWFIANDYPLSA